VEKRRGRGKKMPRTRTHDSIKKKRTAQISGTKAGLHMFEK
jgi:hypothetical protein